MARARSRLNLLTIRSRSVIFSSVCSSPPRICLPNLPRLLTSDAVDNWVEFFIDESWGAVRVLHEFLGALASQFPLAFSLSSSPSRSSPVPVSLSSSVIMSAAPLKYNICIADDKSTRRSLPSCVFVYLLSFEWPRCVPLSRVISVSLVKRRYLARMIKLCGSHAEVLHPRDQTVRTWNEVASPYLTFTLFQAETWYINIILSKRIIPPCIFPHPIFVYFLPDSFKQIGD